MVLLLVTCRCLTAKASELNSIRMQGSLEESKAVMVSAGPKLNLVSLDSSTDDRLASIVYSALDYQYLRSLLCNVFQADRSVLADRFVAFPLYTCAGLGPAA